MTSKKLKLDISKYAVDKVGGYRVDLGTIPIDSEEELLDDIAKLSFSEITSLTLIRGVKKHQPKGTTFHNLNKTDFFTDSQSSISSTIQFVLKNSSIKSLKLSGFRFSQQDILSIADGMKGNTSLEVLFVDDCPLSSKGFDIIARSIIHLSFKSVGFVKCGLNDQSISSVEYFLKQNSFFQNQQNWISSIARIKENQIVTLNSLDLQYNKFSDNILIQLKELLSELPLSKIDLRKNLLFDERVLSDYSQSIPTLQVLAEVQVRSNDFQRRQQQMAGNPKEFSEDAFEFLPGVLISGPNAKEFSKQFKILMKEMHEIEKFKEKMPRNLAESYPTPAKTVKRKKIYDQ